MRRHEGFFGHEEEGARKGDVDDYKRDTVEVVGAAIQTVDEVEEKCKEDHIPKCMFD